MKSIRNLIILTAGIAALCPRVRGAEVVFDFEVLRYEAKMLAAKPFVQRPVNVPQSLLKLNYDQYRDIRFKPGESLWRRDRLPFEMQFFHPGFSFDRAVQINVVQGKSVEPVAFSRRRCSTTGQTASPRCPPTSASAGFSAPVPAQQAG